ncbi:hypothetical protein DMH03_17205 [Amycolatopsis sp. WAC 01376]|uniref:hypothetical protein n=1 Tax=Amycolatopsis sp. WAC 01376 TaxID=2203195 RepID=UPI000F7B4449|nr:hypothetical protein [Amycolatopsis sp. WAC 01376]RSM60496.1 hypothetical protein DMH03_17205 [Amycolatopsis sp. WAC 01376]
MTNRTDRAPGRGRSNGSSDLGFDQLSWRRSGEIHRARIPSPRSGSLSRAAEYEWHGFLLSAEAHLYLRAQLAPDVDWPPMLLPWCEENRPEPRRHERGSISRERIAAPTVKARCPLCRDKLLTANAEARSGQA